MEVIAKLEQGYHFLDHSAHNVTSGLCSGCPAASSGDP